MAPKIVGRGMIARAFAQSRSDKCLFFCSGVSKSTEKNPEQFEKETRLLNESMDKDGDSCFVYFSSVLAPSESNEYYAHKKRMENLVISNSKTYLIIRLPQVAGSVANDTLLPNFIKKIYLGQNIEVYKNAPRSIIDIDDVVAIFDLVYGSGKRNEIINICPEYSFQPQELVNLISCLLKRQSSCSVLEKTSIQHCESSPIVKKYGYIFGDLNTYLQRVVEKYTPGIIDVLEKNPENIKR